MKNVLAAMALFSLASATYAGNIDTFVSPPPEEPPAATMGGSNAAWIIPLVAIIAIAAVVTSDDDDPGDRRRESPRVDEPKCPADPRCAGL